MEKLVYVLWKPEGLAPAAFRDALLGEVAPALAEHGARHRVVLACDEHCEPVQKARITRLDPPLGGMVSFWLDSVDDRAPLEAAIAAHSGRLAGYLVTESVPRRNQTHRAPVGERTPGITMLTCIEKPDRLTTEDWIAHWHGHHTPMANEVQCTYLYVRNVVARALTADAPPWRGIVEEGFPVEAVTDPMLWYKADGDPAVFKRNLDRMLESVRAFLDIDRVEHHPMSEYRLDAD